MSQFDDDSEWYGSAPDWDDSEWYGSAPDWDEEERYAFEAAGKLSIEIPEEKDVMTVNNLSPGQMFRFVGSFTPSNIYMVLQSEGFVYNSTRIQYMMLKDGRIYSSARNERRKVVLVDATLTVHE